MHIRGWFAMVGVGAALASVTSTASSADSTSSASAAMPNRAFMLGTWDCTVRLAGMGGRSAITVRSTLTITSGPNGTQHTHISSQAYAGDNYEGFDTKNGVHWVNGADSVGAASFETSSDGIVFTGTTWENGAAMTTRDTRTRIGATKIRDISEVKANGKWSHLLDAVCYKP